MRRGPSPTWFLSPAGFVRGEETGGEGRDILVEEEGREREQSSSARTVLAACLSIAALGRRTGGGERGKDISVRTSS
jgi:hypothetical protein